MSTRYFSNFPIATYSLDANAPDNTNLQLVTNIFRRVHFREEIDINAKLFYPYTIKDSDRPEIIADKLYGDVDYYWIVTMFNNIVDPLLDWPMTYNAFQSFIIAKYGSLATAKTQIHHYTKTVTKTNSSGSTSTTHTIDQTTYDTLTSVVPVVYTFADGSTVSITTTRAIVYSYQYEEELNEAKRSIRLLKPEYVTVARGELAKLSV